MLWLTLHSETCQHEPAVYPGKKQQQSNILHSSTYWKFSDNRLENKVETEKTPSISPAYAAGADCPGCDVACN